MRTSNGYEIIIVGSPDDGYTSAEIYLPENSEMADRDILIARVFELNAGWYFEAPKLDILKNPSLVTAICEARDELSHYINRKGASEFPEDATRAGISFWLMQRDDGIGFSQS